MEAASTNSQPEKSVSRQVAEADLSGFLVHLLDGPELDAVLEKIAAYGDEMADLGKHAADIENDGEVRAAYLQGKADAEEAQRDAAEIMAPEPPLKPGELTVNLAGEHLEDYVAMRDFN